MLRYVHTNIVARDWKSLSRFYQEVFACIPVPPRRDLKGEWVERLTGIEGVHIEGEHLRLPGYGEDLPTLEIFSYNTGAQGDKDINAWGVAHIAFEVEDVEETLGKMKEWGGSAVGQVVEREYPGIGVATLVYARDPEGNIVDVQSWKK